MEIQKLSSSLTDKYKTLAQVHGSIFNSLEWLKMYGNAVTVYGIFNNDKKLIGGFHLFNAKLGGVFVHVKNPPFTPHIGLFYHNPSENKSNCLSFEKTVTSSIAQFLNAQKYQILTLALPTSNIDMQSFIWCKYKVIPNYTYQLNLNLDETEILKNLASDKRNSINKAEKDRVTIKFNSDPAIVKQMVENTFTRKAKKLNENLVNSILHEFANESNSFSYVALVDDKVTAVSFCIHDANTAYYLLGGYDNINKHQGSGVLALWHCILHAKKLGLKKFDFEGSMIPQVEKYFRGFGGDLVPYFTLNKASLPIEFALKLFKRETF